MSAMPRRTSHAFRCCLPSGHDAEADVSTITVAHDIIQWRCEWLWSLWFDQTIFVVLVGIANCGLVDNVLAAASYSLHDFFCASWIANDTTRRNQKREGGALLDLNTFFFSSMVECYTCCCTRVVVVVSAQSKHRQPVTQAAQAQATSYTGSPSIGNQ